MKKKLFYLVIDLLIAGFILVVFAYFHHGKRYLDGKKTAAEAIPQSYITVATIPKTISFGGVENLYYGKGWAKI